MFWLSMVSNQGYAIVSSERECLLQVFWVEKCMFTGAFDLGANNQGLFRSVVQ